MRAKYRGLSKGKCLGWVFTNGSRARSSEERWVGVPDCEIASEEESPEGARETEEQALKAIVSVMVLPMRST